MSEEKRMNSGTKAVEFVSNQFYFYEQSTFDLEPDFDSMVASFHRSR